MANLGSHHAFCKCSACYPAPSAPVLGETFKAVLLSHWFFGLKPNSGLGLKNVLHKDITSPLLCGLPSVVALPDLLKCARPGRWHVKLLVW